MKVQDAATMRDGHPENVGSTRGVPACSRLRVGGARPLARARDSATESSSHADGSAGFTLIELLVVLSLIGILAGIAIGQYRTATVKAREAVLKEDLYQLRHLIDQYYADKKKYPPSLESLVEGGYIKKIPVDPVTELATSWVVVREEIKQEDQETTSPVEGSETPPEPGIIDVKSGSSKVSLDGVPYSEW